LEEGFIKHKILYKIIGEIKFYQRREVKDILAYLKLILHHQDIISLQRIINIPPRGIGKQTVRKIFETNLETVTQKNPNVKNFLSVIGKLRKLSQVKPLSFLLDSLLKEINYKKYLESTCQDKFCLGNITEYEMRWQNIKELFTITKSYDKLKNSNGLKKFLEDTALLSESNEIPDYRDSSQSQKKDTSLDRNKQDKKARKSLVNLMTLHAAKGLEFPVVFIIGCEEGLFPHSRSALSPLGVEEERRLCYVGITRAKEYLYLTFAQKRNIYGSTQVNPPSRFLNDIPEKLIERKIIEERENVIEI